MSENELDPPRPAYAEARVGVLDRLAEWRDDPRVGVVAVVLLAVVVGLVWYRAQTSASQVPASASAGTTAPSITRPTTTTTTTTPILLFVHVAGAVTRPGVVQIAAGSRVVDALEAAGGAVADADLDRLNLAAVLTDGQKIAVARVGDPPTPAMPEAAPADSATPTATGPLNLNTATPEQLEELPGIGPALAAAIVAERDRRGGFTDVEQLSAVRGIGDQRLADLRPLVTV